MGRRLDNRIQRKGSDYFRAFLTKEDLAWDYDEVDESGVYEVLDRDTGKIKTFTVVEDIVVLESNPIEVPHMRYLYELNICSLEDNEDVVRIVTDLFFLNPTIGERGVFKMAEYIINHFIDKDFELAVADMSNKIFEILEELDPDDLDIIPQTKIVFYRRGSQFSSKSKSIISNKYRFKRASVLYGELIHEVAQYAIENNDKFLKIKNSTLIKDTPRYIEDAKSNNIPVPITAKLTNKNTIQKHMKEDTRRMLDAENKLRYFYTEDAITKYNDFKTLYSKLSLNKCVKELSISKTTASVFKEALETEQKNLMKKEVSYE